MIKVFPYLLMTDIDSGSLEFMAITEDCCDVGEREMRDILIKIFLDNDIYHRLDFSGEFIEQFGKRNEAIRKQVGLYEFENTEQGIICTICVNLKEYFELYGIYCETNKRHKGIRKGTKGMDFENYAGRILTIDEARDGTKRFAKKQKQTKFKNKKGNMIMVTIEKFEFAQLNDKRYVLPDGTSSLPYCHKHLTFVENFKKSLLPLTPEHKTSSNMNMKHHQYNLIRFEQGILEQKERMRIINCVLLQQPIFFKRGRLKRSRFQISENTRDFLLRGLWRKI